MQLLQITWKRVQITQVVYTNSRVQYASDTSPAGTPTVTYLSDHYKHIQIIQILWYNPVDSTVLQTMQVHDI